VPDKWWQNHERLFLPFADAGEAKVSEVISKVLLLLNDDKSKTRVSIARSSGRRTDKKRYIITKQVWADQKGVNATMLVIIAIESSVTVALWTITNDGDQMV
jgi:hypothetical protein